MPFSKYKGYRLRNKVFWGFLIICLLSIVGSGILSFFILRNNAVEQGRTDLQKKSESLMSSLDYAVSNKHVETDDLPKVLANDIFEIADVNNQDIIIYTLEGKFLISNKDFNLLSQKQIPIDIVNRILKSDKRLDFQNYDEKTEGNVTSSYMILKNNMLEPIGIVYFPYYHNDRSYVNVFNKYVNYIVIVNLFIIAFAV